MRDVLMQAQNTPFLKDILKAAGLPSPVALKRGRGPYETVPLTGMTVVLGGAGPARGMLEDAVVRAGARLVVELPPEERADALVLDATGFATPADLTQLHSFFHPRVGTLARNGRVLVVTGNPATAPGVAQATARRAVEGFVRSLGKELGKKGATANLLYVDDDAHDRLVWPVRFFLSNRSAYVDGQPLTVTARTAAAHAVPPAMVFRGKVALVTGAARGIGEATARRLAADGAHVVCLDVPGDLKNLNATAESVGGTALPLDIRAEDTPGRLVAFVKEKWGGLDVVVHNAGITRDKTLARMDESLWNLVLDINLNAILAVDEALLGADVLRADGRVVCLSSIGGIAGNPGQTNYGATKAGLIAYVAARSAQGAARGITFNAVAPGFIETRMTDAMPVMVREVGRRLNSLSQGGRPEDVAEAITFLASPAAVGLSGQVLRVCGQSLVGA